MIKAAINATGEVTKITVETASNVVGAVSDGVVKAVNPKARQKIMKKVINDRSNN